MQAAERTIVTEDEYIVRERESEHKHELIHGEVVAMAGGSPRHNAITASVIGALRTQLKERPCIVFSSDQRIHVEATGLYTYADISVTFDRPRFHPKHKDTLLNPRLVVEVLSSSTEAYDRGAKFAHYRGLPSFQEYLLISQHVPLAEHYRRLDTGQWILTAYEGEAAIVKLPSLECELPLADVYDKLQLLAPE
ncbi:MAG: Uma2 family endonuclease [Polyangiaceae bacterium]